MFVSFILLRAIKFFIAMARKLTAGGTRLPMLDLVFTPMMKTQDPSRLLFLLGHAGRSQSVVVRDKTETELSELPFTNISHAPPTACTLAANDDHHAPSTTTTTAVEANRLNKFGYLVCGPSICSMIVAPADASAPLQSQSKGVNFVIVWRAKVPDWATVLTISFGLVSISFGVAAAVLNLFAYAKCAFVNWLFSLFFFLLSAPKM